MTATLTSVRKSGKTWEPKFVESLNQETCLGCGRCFKVCGFNVLGLIALNEDGEVVDEDEDEIERKVMNINNAENCVGCQACARICPKNCYTHATVSV